MGSRDDPLVGYEGASTEVRFVNPHRYLQTIRRIVSIWSVSYLPRVLIYIRLIAVQDSSFHKT